MPPALQVHSQSSHFNHCAWTHRETSAPPELCLAYVFSARLCCKTFWTLGRVIVGAGLVYPEHLVWSTLTVWSTICGLQHYMWSTSTVCRAPALYVEHQCVAESNEGAASLRTSLLCHSAQGMRHYTSLCL